MTAVGKPDLNSPWGKMDSGPFLAHTSGAPSPSDNVTLKGVAVKLGAKGEAKGGVLFDTQPGASRRGLDGRVPSRSRASRSTAATARTRRSAAT